MAKKPEKTPTEEAHQIGQKKLKSLLAAARSAAEDSHEITSSLGGKIASAVENDHLHKKAFSTLRMMDKLTPEKLRNYWDTLEYYVDISGLGDRAASAPALPLDGEDGTEEEEQNEAAESTGKRKRRNNVQPFPKPTAIAAE